MRGIHMSKNLRLIRFVIVIFVLGIITSSIVAVVNYKKQLENAEPPLEYVEMPDSQFPDVVFGYEETRLNFVQGYAQTMNMNLVRGSVTPVSTEMKIPVFICEKDNQVTGISFRIRSLGDGKLLEDTSVTNWTKDGTEIKVELSLSTLIKTEIEYLLELILKTDTHEEIHYYTRIKCGQQKSVLELLQFANEFSEATFQKTQSVIVPYMLSRNPKTEDDLAYVDLNSRYALLTWGGINPSRTSEYEIYLTELGEEQISVNLKYAIKSNEGDNKSVTYDVNEFYCLRMRGKQVYILNFFRTMEEVQDIKNVVMTNGKVNLGMNQNEVQVLSSTKGAYTVFTYNKGLWLYEKETEQLLCLYSDVSLGNKSYDIQIASVQEDGTVTFAVYGYIGRGELEGKNVLCWFSYDREKNALSKSFEIPLEQTYEFLVGEQLLATYGTQNGDCYFRLNEMIYYVKKDSRQLKVIADGILENCFFQNENGNLIAWQDEDKIAIFNMETNTIKTVTAQPGEVITIQGLNGDDLVYAISRESDNGKSANREMITPFYALIIMNEKGEEVHRYQKDGMYIESTVIETGKIIVNRLQKTEDGIYAPISYDVLLSNSATAENAYTKLSVVNNGKYRKENVLQITNAKIGTVTAMKTLPTILKQKEQDIQILLENQKNFLGKYQVYAGGELIFQTNDIAEAIKEVYDKAGTVVGENLRCYWERSVRKSYVLLPYENRRIENVAENLLNCMEVMVQTVGGKADLVQEVWNKKQDVTQTLETVLNKEIINIQGVSVAAMLHYIDENSPILIQLGESNAILIVGYSGNNVMMYDSSGTLLTMDQNTLENLMKNANIATFVCIMN